MKDRIIGYWNSATTILKDGLEKARSTGTARKVLIAVAGLSAAILMAFIILKALGSLFDAIYAFVDRHFFGIAASGIGGGYLINRRNEKRSKIEDERKRQKAALDNQRTRFARGCYARVAQFLYANICATPGFQDLTSCTRPIRPADMGNERLDAYSQQGVMYLRYSLPKMTTELLNTAMIKSTMQGLIDQSIRTGGIAPFIAAGENRYLHIDKVEDMQTYVSLTFVIDFDDQYIQQAAFQSAMNDMITRDNSLRQLEDNDYHE